MQRLAAKIISAICYAIGLQEWSMDDGPYAAPYNDLARFVERQFGNMPAFLRLGLLLATLFFDLSGLWRGALFHRLTPERQHLQMGSWRASRIGPFRDFMKFYDSLCLLALYSRRGEPVEDRFVD